MGMLLTPEAVGGLLANLFGKKVPTKKVAALPGDQVNRGVIATYVRDDGSLGAVAIADIPLTANAGAALSLIPPGLAKEMASGGEVVDTILENFQEILNIGSRWFNSPRTPHVTLKDVWTKPSSLPAEVGMLIASPGFRLDVEMSIPGYGDGRLSLLAK